MLDEFTSWFLSNTKRVFRWTLSQHEKMRLGCHASSMTTHKDTEESCWSVNLSRILSASPSVWIDAMVLSTGRKYIFIPCCRSPPIRRRYCSGSRTVSTVVVNLLLSSVPRFARDSFSFQIRLTVVNITCSWCCYHYTSSVPYPTVRCEHVEGVRRCY